jgi:hypothetical protein
VALHLDVEVRAAEHADQRIEEPADAEPVGLQQRLAGHRDEAGDVTVQVGQRQRPFAFRRAELHRRDEAAEILPTLLGRDKDR